MRHSLLIAASVGMESPGAERPKSAVDVVLTTKAAILSRRLTESGSVSSSATTSHDIGLLSKYEGMLNLNSTSSLQESIMELRRFVLENGLPRDISFGGDSLRSKLWKLFLGSPLTLDTDCLVQKLAQPRPFESKIRDDTFRTFKSDEQFWSHIDENTLLRVLNAAAVDHGYVQGMNVLLGPFLHVMPELDSYHCFNTLLRRHIPRYVMKNLDGAHSGVALADKCLAVLDPQLHKYIVLKLRTIAVFSLRYVLTLLANVQPLSEVLRLWDAIFAFGTHFGIILFCAHLILMRDKILAESSSYRISCIIQQGTLDSELLVQTGLCLAPFIPKPLFADLIAHCF